jgi:tRNA A-37 threonylcarbamoyl transferase component Bud32
MPARSAEPTATFAAPGGDETAPYSSRPTGGFDEELRQLLRSRLILVQLLVLGYYALLAITISSAPGASFSLDLWTWALIVGSAAPCLVGAVALWRSPAVGLRPLRRWELFLFAIQAAVGGAYRYATLVSDVEDSPVVTTGFRGIVTLLNFSYLILAYGVLIPNTRRRTLWVVGGLAAVPFVTLAAAVAATPALQGISFAGLMFQTATHLIFPAAIAVFAAARAAALQRRAYEAERRAEQVGQYTLGRKLGEGGMGEVFLAEHRLLKRPCAVKFIRPELAAHPGTAARFAREVEAVTGLTHANTVRVYDYGRADDGSFYYVMEYLDGPTLDRLVADYGPLPPGRVVHLLRQLCGALAEAHAAGLVHRDLKPGNVIVARLGGVCDVAKLLDFGLVLDESAVDDRLTRAGVVLGTPAYMAPEQAAGEPVDARGDAYSLGAVAYFALLGRPPFGGKNARQVMAAHRTEPIPALDGVPADLAAVVTRCLAKDPADRFPSVRNLDRALAACGCAADWSAEQAGTWWAEGPNTAAGLTRSVQ